LVLRLNAPHIIPRIQNCKRVALTTLKLDYNWFTLVLPFVEEEIRRIIRDEQASDPLITVSGLEHALETHLDRGFSHQYVSKVADKVSREGLIEMDGTRIEERMLHARELPHDARAVA
jgi:hypothetical protein